MDGLTLGRGERIEEEEMMEYITTDDHVVESGSSPVTAYDAYELFGEMRSSTEEEIAAYRKMKAELRRPTGVNVFDLC